MLFIFPGELEEGSLHPHIFPPAFAVEARPGAGQRAGCVCWTARAWS